MNLNKWPKSGSLKAANFWLCVFQWWVFLLANLKLAEIWPQCTAATVRYLAAIKLLGPINVKATSLCGLEEHLLSYDCPLKYLFGGCLWRYCAVSLLTSTEYHHKASCSYGELLSQFRYVIFLSLWSRRIIAMLFSLDSSILTLYMSAPIRITTLYKIKNDCY